ncbi:helix-turn-helix domain-containing protein [Nostoc sp. FACHB-110]|uniref:helix-turn-helix domain-containing protein n=1 Tax=Nostoc sp. FACHB-110 TaxID=2692834 RepID=UPI00168233DE|nr:AraC family transcriptional regulator [Nostoc sp. FACHB-110]MBD2435914.1 helix-turn-helix transcriptional regulator [Nostoc sp. FACHB-110]
MESNYLLNGIDSYKVNIAINTAILTNFEKFLLQSQPLLSRVFRFIEMNYHNSISLREVAEAVSRSPAYLTDLVRRETGKTVLCWIVERRMVEARRLLIETDQSVEQIAEAVGYLDRRHFGRQFLRLHNTTPQTWRRSYRSNNTPRWQKVPQTTNSTETINQESKTVAFAEAQRLQACIQEIVAIFHQSNVVNEVLMFKSENGSVAKIDNGLIQITFVPTCESC